MQRYEDYRETSWESDEMIDTTMKQREKKFQQF